MSHRPTVARLALPLAVLAAAGCASAPPAGEPSADGRGPTPLPSLVCGQGAREIDLRRTGVPSELELLDVALAGDRAWVLAGDRFLAEVPRDGAGSARFLRGREDTPPWDAVAADPADGKLWIVSRNSFDLVHFDPVSGRTRRITVERATGPGGFSDVAGGPGVVYVTPTCSDHAVWTIDPVEGRLLDRSFALEDLPGAVRQPAGPGGATPVDVPCSIASLATGPDGTVYASWGGAVYRPTADGWEEVPALAPSGAAAALVGLDVGERTETWFFENAHRFLFVDGDPVWVGGPALSSAADRRGVVLFRRGADGRLIPHLERCLGPYARAFAADDAGYAFLTGDTLVYGPAPPAPAGS